MTMYRLTVCLLPFAGTVEDAITTAMAPFQMYGTDDWSEDWRWDSWTINAGDDLRFPVKPEHDGDARLVYGDRYGTGAKRKRLTLQCDGGPRGLLALDRLRELARTETEQAWHTQQEAWQRLVAEHPPARPLPEFLAAHHANPDAYARDQAVADHHAQPLIQALNHDSLWDRHPGLAQWMLGPDTDPITFYSRAIEADLDVAATWALPTSALLTHDGRWIEPSEPGDFTQPRDGERDQDAYARCVTKYLEELDEACVIVRLRCHC